MSSAGDAWCRTVSEQIDIRAYREGDERAIVKMLDLPVGNDAALAYWRWKLMHWPSEAANVWLADVDGNAVFHYGGIPLPFQIEGATSTVMISVDAMTLPEYRRRGLLTRGASRAFEEWKAQGIPFTLGLPNERWGSRIAATGWQKLFPLQWVVRPIRPEGLAAHRLNLPGLRRATIVSGMWRRLLRNRPRRDSLIEFQDCTAADGRFDSLWARCRSNALFSTVRDSAWVQWRFLSFPTRKYDVVLARRGDEAVGYYAIHVAKKPERVSAFLAEIVGIDNDASVLESVLAAAIARADSAGADFLATLAVPGTDIYRLLRRAGCLRGPAFSVYIALLAENLPMDRLRDPRNWYLSGADFDVI